mgnify:CR=1 FL=1
MRPWRQRFIWQTLPVNPVRCEAKPSGTQGIPCIARYKQHFVFVHSNGLLNQAITLGRRFEQANGVD